MPKNTLIPQEYGVLAPPLAEQSMRLQQATAFNRLNGYFPGATTENDTWTLSVWFKRTNNLTSGMRIVHAEIDGTNFTSLFLQANQTLRFEARIANVIQAEFTTSKLIRDNSNWYHIYILFNRLAGTLQLFVNGVIWLEYTVFPTIANVAGYAWLHASAEHIIGADKLGSGFRGLLADVQCIGGSAPGTPDAFGFGTFNSAGTWQHSLYAGPWGTHGFNLSFGRTVDLGEDFSGNGNDFLQAGNLGPADQFNDWPERNYCILSVLDPRTTGTVDQGGLVLTGGVAAVTLRPPANSGVYYYERNGVAQIHDTGVSGAFDPLLTAATYNFGQQPFVDVGPSGGQTTLATGNLPPAPVPNARARLQAIRYTGNGVNPRTITTGAAGDPAHRTLVHRTDMLWLKNASSGAFGHFTAHRLRPGAQTPINTTGPEQVTNVDGRITALGSPGPGFNVDAGATSDDNVNDSGGIAYSAISWSVAQYAQQRVVNASTDDAEEDVSGGIPGPVDLTSSDLELVLEGGSTEQQIGMRFTDLQIPQGATIVDARLQFECDVTNTGVSDMLIFCQDADNAGTFVAAAGNISGRAVTGAGTAWSPADWNVVQERAAPQRTTNFASQLQGVVNRGGWAPGNAVAVIIKGDPGGTLGEREAESFNGVGNPPELQVSWTVGSPLANFGLFRYSGIGSARDVMHGLTVAPNMIAIKRRDVAADWAVYFSTVQTAGTPENGRMAFNNSNAWAAGADWDNTAPGASVFRVGTPARVNAAGGSYAGFCAANLAGHCQVFRYVGNGNASGPFIYCGFKPRVVLIKRTGLAADWILHQRGLNTLPTANSVFNLMNGALRPNTFNAGFGANGEIDVYSNGFKIRTANAVVNANTAEYVGIAFAEAPFSNSKAAP